MKKLHSKILEILEKDARVKASEIAVMLSESESDVTKAISELEKSGVILKYGVIVDEEKLDKDSVQALIEVKVAPKSEKGFDEIATDIGGFDEVKSLYLMSGAYDLCIIIEGKTLREVALFVSEKLSRFDSVLSTATHFILKKYKIDGASIIDGNLKRLVIQP